MVGEGTGYHATPIKDILAWYRPDSSRTFIDIGCGKGRVLRMWHILNSQNSVTQTLVGIESDPELAAYAASKGDGKYTVVVGDAAKHDYSQYGPVLCWLFNPFGDLKMKQLARKLDEADAIVIANNPAHVDILLRRQWQPLVQYQGEVNHWYMLGNNKKETE